MLSELNWKTLKLEIQKLDIDAAILHCREGKGTVEFCAVSLAAKRQFNNPAIVSAGGLIKANGVVLYNGGMKLERFMDHFDFNYKHRPGLIKPASFELTIPKSSTNVLV